MAATTAICREMIAGRARQLTMYGSTSVVMSRDGAVKGGPVV